MAEPLTQRLCLVKIVCPHCSSVFAVPDDMLGPKGRKVKCASCAQVWHAQPPQPPEATIAANVASLVDADILVEARSANPGPADHDDVPTVPGWDFSSNDPSGGFFAKPDEALASGPVDTGLDESVMPGPVVGKQGSQPRIPGFVRLKGASRGPSLAHIMLGKVASVVVPVGIFIGLFGLVLAIPQRDAITRAVPDLARLYTMVGLDVNVRGVEFSTFGAERSTVAGLTVLRIEGTLINPGERPVDLGALRVALLGGNGSELFVWRVEPDSPNLAAGQSLVVASELTSPPENVASVAVRFLQDGERLPGQAY